MHEHHLYLWHKKCEFERTCIEYLGIIISHNRVKMDLVKIASVAEWPTPTNKKEVQSFVRFANFYCRFIEGFSHYARPLFNLTKKDVRFAWSLAQQGAFEKLKSLITLAPVLTLPDESQPYCDEADGSGVATGAVLSQLLSEDGKWHPVAFLLKSLLPVMI